MEQTKSITTRVTEQTARYLGRMYSVWPKYPTIERVVLFGSRAKGIDRPNSDLDLVVYTDALSNREWRQLDDAIDDLYLPITVDLLRAGDVRHPGLLEHIARVGITIYERTLPKETDL
jgi:predicted nucleotidyltransferase